MLRTIQNSIATVFAKLTTKAVARSPRQVKPRSGDRPSRLFSIRLKAAQDLQTLAVSKSPRSRLARQTHNSRSDQGTTA